MVADPGGGDEDFINKSVAVAVDDGEENVTMAAGTGLRSVGLMSGKERRYAAVIPARQRHQRASDGPQELGSIGIRDSRTLRQPKDQHVAPGLDCRSHQAETEIAPIPEDQWTVNRFSECDLDVPEAFFGEACS